jgi:hypothetical protein
MTQRIKALNVGHLASIGVAGDGVLRVEVSGTGSNGSAVPCGTGVTLKFRGLVNARIECRNAGIPFASGSGAPKALTTRSASRPTSRPPLNVRPLSEVVPSPAPLRSWEQGGEQEENGRPLGGQLDGRRC